MGSWQHAANAILGASGSVKVDTVTGAITLTPAASVNPGLLLAQTWNNGATTFAALRINVTDTASAGASNLLDLQVGGASQLTVNKSGNIEAGQIYGSLFGDTGNGMRLQKSYGGPERASLWVFGASSTAASGRDYACVLKPIINQSGTGAFTGLLYNATETALGSGGHTLLDLQVGGASKFLVSNAGAVTIAGALDHDGTTAGFFGITPASRATAYTQTYATADKTHANAGQTAVATTAATQTTPFGYTTAAQADDIVAQLNNARLDILDLKQLVNSIIDDLQAYGLLQ